MIITEMFYYVPYERIEIFLSKENVPHTEIIGNGYDSMGVIEPNAARLRGNKKTTEGMRVNTNQLSVNLLVTTVVVFWIYLLFIYPENKNKALKSELELLKKVSTEAANNSSRPTSDMFTEAKAVTEEILKNSHL